MIMLLLIMPASDKVPCIIHYLLEFMFWSCFVTKPDQQEGITPAHLYIMICMAHGAWCTTATNNAGARTKSCRSNCF